MSNNNFIVVNLLGYSIEYPETRIINGKIQMEDVLAYCEEQGILDSSVIGQMNTFLTKAMNNYIQSKSWK